MSNHQNKFVLVRQAYLPNPFIFHIRLEIHVVAVFDDEDEAERYRDVLQDKMVDIPVVRKDKWDVEEEVRDEEPRYKYFVLPVVSNSAPAELSDKQLVYFIDEDIL